RRHTRFSRDWSSDVCSSDLLGSRGVVADGLIQVVRRFRHTVRPCTRPGFPKARPKSTTPHRGAALHGVSLAGSAVVGDQPHTVRLREARPGCLRMFYVNTGRSSCAAPVSRADRYAYGTRDSFSVEFLRRDDSFAAVTALAPAHKAAARARSRVNHTPVTAAARRTAQAVLLLTWSRCRSRAVHAF